jgi:hypothetical protein
LVDFTGDRFEGYVETEILEVHVNTDAQVKDRARTFQ